MNAAYLELRLAWQLHGSVPEALPDATRRQLQVTLSRQQVLEQAILQSPEAMHAMVPAAALAGRLEAIRARYADLAEFRADLARLGMDEAALEAQVARELRIESTLERIVAAVPAVTAAEAEIFYHLHPEKFFRPERRQLRHILITFDSRQAGNAARQTLRALCAMAPDAEAFAAAALRHSHCPTALEGGMLGWMVRGQLFATLEKAAFSLVVGELSAPVQSEMGWHLLRCEAIDPESHLPFIEVREVLQEKLGAQRAERRLREWIAGCVRQSGRAGANC